MCQEGGGGRERRQQSQAVPPDILTPRCISVPSPWKLGLSVTWRALKSLLAPRTPRLLLWTWLSVIGLPLLLLGSHRGREQLPLLWVRRRFAGLLHFLCVVRQAVVGVRWRFATPATLRPRRFSRGCRGRAHLWPCVTRPRWGRPLLPLNAARRLSLWVCGWAAGRWRLGRWWRERASTRVVAARGLVRTCFGLDDDRRAEGRGWVRLWRQRGGRGGRADPDEGGWTGGLRPGHGASGGMEVYRERGETRSGGSDGEGSLGVQREVMGGEVLQLTWSGWGGVIAVRQQPTFPGRRPESAGEAQSPAPLGWGHRAQLHTGWRLAPAMVTSPEGPGWVSGPRLLSRLRGPPPTGAAYRHLGVRTGAAVAGRRGPVASSSALLLLLLLLRVQIDGRG